MPQTKCGFDNSPGASGSDLLVAWGPTLIVNVGFDPDFKGPPRIPVPGISDIRALVDTGATECCIDSLLASQLGLPVVDRRSISGVGGRHVVNVHLAQVFVSSLNFIMYGMFAAVDLAAGGQAHRVLMGRTFLRAFTMTYEGRTGTVTISSL
jgi:predicted aspartyl protease